MPTGISVIEASCRLGPRAPGVERLPEALLGAGLLRGFTDVEAAGRVEGPQFDGRRDPATALLNGPAIRDYSRKLAEVVGPVVGRGRFALVLGGDCSVLLGALLALRRAEAAGAPRRGLFFLDGHADFYQPEAEQSGEVASMELALSTGRGPVVLADVDGLGPLVREADVVAVGPRDAEQAALDGSQDIADSEVRCYDLARVREMGVGAAVAEGLAHLTRAPDGPGAFWVHLDADVLDDTVMPAVDYRQPGGLSPEEVTAALHTLLGSGRAVGMTVTIYNPALDPAGAAARTLAGVIAGGLSALGGGPG